MAVYNGKKFSSNDEALEYFENHFNYKYDTMLADVNGKRVLVIGSDMAVDYDFAGSIEGVLSDYFSDLGLDSNLATDMTSELRDEILDLLIKWNIVDEILFVTDTF